MKKKRFEPNKWKNPPSKQDEYWKHPDIYTTQTQRIFKRFGGAGRLARILKFLFPDLAPDRTAIYKWDYPPSKQGCGGVVPKSALDLVRRAAAYDGILLTKEDLYPYPLLKRDKAHAKTQKQAGFEAVVKNDWDEILLEEERLKRKAAKRDGD